MKNQNIKIIFVDIDWTKLLFFRLGRGHPLLQPLQFPPAGIDLLSGLFLRLDPFEFGIWVLDRAQGLVEQNLLTNALREVDFPLLRIDRQEERTP